ncbi:hypothetical protein NDU88_005853 [Pleurodeles waltl]|uniref:Uncharacterized protein n=1 Tax=Pleurodeles waltl TaxID=8319 RepID=A0AAV7UJW9_PLEWA|nr:hypothetical protein NDU88_005853 [Pleurodeles waltl]
MGYRCIIGEAELSGSNLVPSDVRQQDSWLFFKLAFGADKWPAMSLEDEPRVAVSALELANSCCTTTNACNTSSIDAILHYTEREEYYSWARYSVTL